MDVHTIEKLTPRIKIAEGTVDEEPFAVSVLVDASGVVIEFDNEHYFVPTEEIVKEVIKERNEFRRSRKSKQKENEG